MDSSIDGNEKQNIYSNFNKIWSANDVIIYTSSVSVGVNYDIKNKYNSLYIILSKNCCSARDVMQMSARVRHFKNNDIYILNTKKEGYNHKYDIINFYDFEQLKYNYLKLYINDNTNDEIIYDNNIKTINKIIQLNELIYIYNLVEQENNTYFYIYSTLKKLIIDKVYNFFEKYDLLNKNLQNINIIKDKILTADIIDNEKYEIIKIRKKKNETTKIENFEYEKKYYMELLNVNKLDDEIYKTFYKKTYLISNFLSLFRYKQKKDDKFNNLINTNKFLLINKIIHDIGFNENIFNKKLLEQDIIINNINNNIIPLLKKNKNIITKINLNIDSNDIVSIII